MAKPETVRIEIPAGTRILRGDGMLVEVKKTLQVEATRATWRGMTTGYTFQLRSNHYRVSGAKVRRIEAEDDDKEN